MTASFTMRRETFIQTPLASVFFLKQTRGGLLETDSWLSHAALAGTTIPTTGKSRPRITLETTRPKCCSARILLGPCSAASQSWCHPHLPSDEKRLKQNNAVSAAMI